MIRRTVGERVFNIFNIAFCGFLCILTLVPILYILRLSLDTGAGGELSLALWPKQFSLFYYRTIFKNNSIYRPFLNSVYITIVGTSLSVFLNAMGAYTLSKRELPGNKFLIYYLVILPMLFSGGLIPRYILIRELGLIDKLCVLFLPVVISGWNMVLIRNYYWSIPTSLAESARMDGANEFFIFINLIIPLAKPVLAAIALFSGVSFWNTFFSAIIYINSPEKYTFTVKLREMIVVQQDLQGQFETTVKSFGDRIELENLNQQGFSSAMIFISMFPVMLVYPYLQKHFASGLMVESVKGWHRA